MQKQLVLALFGATGETGVEVAKLATSRGHRTACLVRNTLKASSVFSTLPEKERALIKMTQGNITQRDEVEKIFTENKIDVVIYMVAGVTNQPTADGSVGTQNVTDSMKKHKVKRGFFITSAGMSQDLGAFEWFYVNVMIPYFLSHAYDDMCREENVLKNCDGDVEWCIVRPPELFNRAPKLKYRMAYGDTTTRSPNPMSRACLADFLVKSSEKWILGEEVRERDEVEVEGIRADQPFARQIITIDSVEHMPNPPFSERMDALWRMNPALMQKIVWGGIGIGVVLTVVVVAVLTKLL